MEFPAVRVEKIDELSRCALEGMRRASRDANPAEVISAIFTLTATAVESVLAEEAVEVRAHNEDVLRDCLAKLYAMIHAARVN